jgi:hypothetical protein
MSRVSSLTYAWGLKRRVRNARKESGREERMENGADLDLNLDAAVAAARERKTKGSLSINVA